DPATIMQFGADVDVLRVSVNVGNSLGSSGISTYLAPSMTVGTGFFGRSSLTENLEPKHLVQWVRLAYDRDPAEQFGDLSGLVPWETPAGPMPPYPLASNMAEDGRGGYPDAASNKTPRRGDTPARDTGGSGLRGAMGEVPDAAALREVIRRIVIEELARLAGGARGWVAVVYLSQPAAAADVVLPGDVDPGEPAAQRCGGAYHGGGAGVGYRAGDGCGAKARRGAGGDPRGRAAVRVPGDPWRQRRGARGGIGGAGGAGCQGDRRHQAAGARVEDHFYAGPA